MEECAGNKKNAGLYQCKSVHFTVIELSDSYEIASCLILMTSTVDPRGKKGNEKCFCKKLRKRENQSGLTCRSSIDDLTMMWHAFRDTYKKDSPRRVSRGRLLRH